MIRWLRKFLSLSLMLCIAITGAYAEQTNMNVLEAIVNTKSSPLTMRESPSQNGKKITEIRKGETVTVLVDGEWPLIEYNGKQGYVNSKYLMYTESEKKDILDEPMLLPMRKASKFGLINQIGDWTVEPQWDYISYRYKLGNGIYAYKVYNGIVKKEAGFITDLGNGKWGLIDGQGNVLLPCKWTRMIIGENGYVACLNERNESSLYHFEENNMQMIIEECDGINFPYEGFFEYKKDGKWSYANVSGEKLWKENTYDETMRFAEGVAAVKREGKYGFIDQHGDYVLTPNWEDCGYFAQGMCPVSNGEKWGYINHDGKWVIKPQYDEAGVFSQAKVAVVKIAGKELLIDTNGRKITSTFDTLTYNEETGNYIASKNKKQGMLNERGKEIIPLKYNDIVYLGEDVFLSVTNEYRLWNTKGQALFTINATYAKQHNLFQVQFFAPDGCMWNENCILYADGNLMILDLKGNCKFYEKDYRQQAKEENKVETIYVNDYCFEIRNEEAIVIEYLGPENKVIEIPSQVEKYPVTGIGGDAFRRRGELYNASIVIPEGITIIEKNTFALSGISGDLILPDSIMEIGQNAFYHSNFNGKLVLPKKLKEIKFSTFAEANFSGELILPEGLEIIGEKAFYYCKGLEGKLVIPDSVKQIGQNAFTHCPGFDCEVSVPKDIIIEENAFDSHMIIQYR